jgi:hypothetical protein
MHVTVWCCVRTAVCEVLSCAVACSDALWRDVLCVTAGPPLERYVSLQIHECRHTVTSLQGPPLTYVCHLAYVCHCRSLPKEMFVTGGPTLTLPMSVPDTSSRSTSITTRARTDDTSCRTYNEGASTMRGVGGRQAEQTTREGGQGAGMYV